MLLGGSGFGQLPVPLLLLWLNSVLFRTSGVIASAPGPSYLRSLAGKDDFVDACVGFLLSDSVVEDGLISQNDFTAFLLQYCKLEQVCSADMELEYWQLSVQLQLSFVFLICGDLSFDDRVTCLRELQDEGGQFGYVVTDETIEAIESDILVMCTSIYELVADMGLLADSAAPSPALPQTVAPSTFEPMVSLSDMPSEIPMNPPSMSPSTLTVAQPTITTGATPTTGTSPVTPTVKSGATSPSGIGPPSTRGSESNDDDLGGGVIAGISVAAIAILLVVTLFVRRRKRHAANQTAHRDRDMVVPYEVHGDESILTEDSHVLRFVPTDIDQKDFVIDVQSLDGSSEWERAKAGSGDSPKIETSSQRSYCNDSSGSGDRNWLTRDHSGENVESGPTFKDMELVAGAGSVRAFKPTVETMAQFDPDSAAGIAFYRRRDEGDEQIGQSIPRVTNQASFSEKIASLEAAMSAADWSAVADLASFLEEADDLSSLSGSVGDLASSSLGIGAPSNLAPTPMPSGHLNFDDQARATKLDELLEQGDWSALRSLATAYHIEQRGEDTSERDEESTNRSVRSDSSKRASLMDVATGQSSSTLESTSAEISHGGAEEDICQVGPVLMEAKVPSTAILGTSIAKHETASTSNEAVGSGHAVTPTGPASGGDVTVATAACGGTSSAVSRNKDRWGRLFRRGSIPHGKGKKGTALEPHDGGDDTYRLATKGKDNHPEADTNHVSGIQLCRPSEQFAAAPSAGGSQSSGGSQRAQLDEAVACADWAAVEYLSGRIEAAKKKRNSGVIFAYSAGNERAKVLEASSELCDVTDDSIIKSRLSSPSCSESPEEEAIGLVSRSTMLANARAQSNDRSAIALRTELELAVSHGDWPKVEELSGQILASYPYPARSNRHVILTEFDEGFPCTPILSTDGVSSTEASSPPLREIGSLPSTPGDWPCLEKEKIDRVGQLVNSCDWKGVNVLAGLYEMEASGSLSPRSSETVNSHSADCEANGSYIQTWLGVNPLSDHSGFPTNMNRRPVSPAPSSSTSSIVEQQTLREFERLVDTKDWVGLAAFAGSDDAGEAGEGRAIGPQVFSTGPQFGQQNLDLEKDRLKKTPARSPKSKEEVPLPFPSTPTLMIPYWEDKAQSGGPDAREPTEGKPATKRRSMP